MSAPFGHTLTIHERYARAFMKMLDADREWWEVRTFDDDKTRKLPTLVKTFRMARADFRAGSSILAELTALNKQGAGVFVTINRTDGKGKSAANVTDVVALFADTDGAPLEPMLALQPHIVIESSPGNWHAYWRVSDCALDQFKPIQQAIVAKFGTDSNVCDLPRVLRLPGFYHRKGEPFLVNLPIEQDADGAEVFKYMNPDREPYTAQGIVAGLGLTVGATRTKAAHANAKPAKTARTLDGLTDERRAAMAAAPVNSLARDLPPPETPEEIAKVKAMLAAIKPDCKRAIWRDIVWSIQAHGWTCADDLAREWSERGKKWDENDFVCTARSFDPNREGGISWRTLHHYATTPGDWREPTEVTVTSEGGALTPVSFVRADQGDVTNGAAFARMNVRRLLFIPESNEWLRFDPDAGWLKPESGEAYRAAKNVLAELAKFAAEQFMKNPRSGEAKALVVHAQKAHDLKQIKAMIELAKSEPGMSVSLASFDADPMLLGVSNGVLDLRPVKLLRTSPDLRVSKRANATFDPDADCPLWEEFLRRVQPDQEMREFLRRLCGYFLTGSVRDHIFPVLHGGGRNGKGVFLETIAHVLGDYSTKIQTEMLMEHKRSPQAASPDLMRLRGARLAYCSETSEGQRLDSTRVKELTGGDTIKARQLYSNEINFCPTHKLMLMGNFKPEVADMSDGMWQRMLLIPFDVFMPEAERDLDLPEKLKGETSGILNWALAGWCDYARSGLQVPKQVSRATDAYKDENDLLSMWVRELCDLGSAHSERKTALYFSYTTWCSSNGTPAMSQHRFTRRLNKRHNLTLATDERTIMGIRLKNQIGNL